MAYGSGGRDHSLADRYGESQHVDKVYLMPGNPGVLYTPKGQRGLIELVKKEIVNPTVNEIYNHLGWSYKGILLSNGPVKISQLQMGKLLLQQTHHSLHSHGR